ncbi:hypothetical protein DFP92_10480 [Yoonia sediminilitoris]|uniref:Uncharacterized protein n=2 Tax=Yoonia sediminilitoris TaxID=1286148 RepID=A0A2T6KI98_9RHOB|nr:hypothetical protein C8N45_10480 [Yoonia sediminilitoris]RCW96070.1 hypothetical protein DFP92_10480 [Yoonia sediminilitoris]
MGDFLRPEVRAFLIRWREVLIAGAAALFGLWWALSGVGITFWMGLVILAISTAWGFAAVQRVRFAQDGEGPGVVQIKERRLGYFGPLDGGMMDLDEMNMLELDPGTYPNPSWILTGMGGQRIAIPVNAKGADALFDIFAALPGINTSAVLDVLSRTPDVRVTVWSRVRPLLH